MYLQVSYLIFYLFYYTDVNKIWVDEYFKTAQVLVFEIGSASLYCLFIYITSISSCFSYNRHKFIIFTISYFSYIVPNLTKKLYKNFELIHKISKIANLDIFFINIFINASISNPYAIPYCLDAKILNIIYLHIIKN